MLEGQAILTGTGSRHSAAKALVYRASQAVGDVGAAVPTDLADLAELRLHRVAISGHPMSNLGSRV